MAKITYYDDVQEVSKLNLPWEKLSGCNILVTGATGLIGNCVVDVLMMHPNRDYSVYALGRNTERMERLYDKYKKDGSFHVLLKDITNPLVCSVPFHFIIHAASGAAPSDFVNNPVEVMKANIIGLINLMDYGLNNCLKRLLFVSSGEIYGEGDGRVFSEDYSGYVNPLVPRSCYPSSKRAAESLCASYISEYNADIVVARPCHVYGPHFTDNDNRVYAQFIRNILHDDYIVMKSSGEQFRSWCYVVDCVSALFYILLFGETCQAYNIADSSSNLRIRELAEIVSSVGGKKIVVDLPEASETKGYNTVTQSFFSTNKVEALGWKVSGSIRDKIQSTIEERKEYEK